MTGGSNASTIFKLNQRQRTHRERYIYRQPATRFVAEFIGTMNRLHGHMDNGIFHCSGGRIAWPTGPASAREVFFRPEDIRPVGAETGADLRGTVTAAFYLGDRTRLLIDVGCEQQVTLEGVVRRGVKVGDMLAMRVDSTGLLAL